MADGPQVAGVAHGAPSGMVTTLEAVVIKPGGERVDLGVIATSDPERAPVTPREES